MRKKKRKRVKFSLVKRENLNRRPRHEILNTAHVLHTKRYLVDGPALLNLNFVRWTKFNYDTTWYVASRERTLLDREIFNIYLNMQKYSIDTWLKFRSDEREIRNNACGRPFTSLFTPTARIYFYQQATPLSFHILFLFFFFFPS